MSETYTVTAKTLEEALELASRLYGGENKEISYDIINIPKKGLFGIGAKEAVIRVTVTENMNDDLDRLVNEIKGYKAKTDPDGSASEPWKKDQDKATGRQQGGKSPQGSTPAAGDPLQRTSKDAAGTAAGPGEQRPPKKRTSDRAPDTREAIVEKKDVASHRTQPVAPDAPGRTDKPDTPKKGSMQGTVRPAVKGAKDEGSPRRIGISEAEMNHALDFINALIMNMGLNAKAVAASAPADEEYERTEGADIYPLIEVVGMDTGILIGHHGETLDALQYLVNLASHRRVLGRSGHESVRITVDIENYRAKREETLRGLARRMAARAVKYKRNVHLEPMNPYERRIIHSELQDYENVSTQSVGSDKNRKVMILYGGPDKAPERRRPRYAGNGRTEGTPSGADSRQRADVEPTEHLSLED